MENPAYDCLKDRVQRNTNDIKELKGRTPNFVGTWESGKTYNKGDVVDYDGSLYYYTACESISNQPPTDDPNFTIYIAKGSKGVGITGVEEVGDEVVGNETLTTVRVYYSDDTTSEFVVTATNGKTPIKINTTFTCYYNSDVGGFVSQEDFIDEAYYTPLGVVGVGGNNFAWLSQTTKLISPSLNSYRIPISRFNNGIYDVCYIIYSTIQPSITPKLVIKISDSNNANILPSDSGFIVVNVEKVVV